MEVAEGVHRLGSRWVNWYAIEQGGKFLLVDTGLPRHARQLRPLLARRGRGVSDVEAVLLTHFHPDHVGSAEAVRVQAGAEIFIHSADAPVARGERRSPPPRVLPHLWRPFVVRYIGSAVRDGLLSVPPVTAASTFEDGEVLELPGRPRVIHTPGHTPGSCALHFESLGVLCSGDAIVTLDALSGRPSVCVTAEPFNTDSEEALRSLAKLASAHAPTLLPGHGEPWRHGVDEAVRLARRAGVRHGLPGVS